MALLKYIGMMILLSVSCVNWAIECYVTLLKDKCWSGYQVHMTIENLKSLNKVIDLDVGPNQTWARKKFDCEASQVLKKSVSFTPAIWDSEKGKIYQNNFMTRLPDTKPAQGVIWSMEVCFPKNFSQVPTPIKNMNDCGCDKTNVPEITNANVMQN